MDYFPSDTVSRVLDYLDFHSLMKLRLVSQDWRNSLEKYCSQKYKSLALIKPGYLIRIREHPPKRYWFFGTLKKKNFVKIVAAMDTDAEKRDVALFISRLFPKVEQFIFVAPLDSFTATVNLLYWMSRWQNTLSTLILVTHNIPEKDRDLLVATAINRLEKLIELELRCQFNVSLLGPTLARIHHLSITFGLIPEDVIDVLCKIGRHCRRLWIEHLYFGAINLRVVHSWINANADLFQSITHFGCSGSFKTMALRLIDRRFSSLRVWYITTELSERFAYMGLISRLDEIRVVPVFRFLPPVKLTVRPLQMVNVRTFEFHNDFNVDETNIHELNNVRQFCEYLAWLMPNVEHLTLGFTDSLVSVAVEASLHEFRKLKTFNFQ